MLSFLKRNKIKKIKQEFAEKYGGRSHEATKNILKELGIEQRILELVDSVGFRQGQDNSASPDFEKKICAYADMRVGPFGVITLEQRFLDLRERYKNHVEGEKNRNVFEAALREIEKQIFAQCKILPTGVNQESVSKKIEELKNYTI